MDAKPRNRRTNPVPPEQRLGLDMQNGADMLSVSRRQLYDLIAEGRIKTVKIGLRRVIPRSEIERLLAEGTEPASSPHNENAASPAKESRGVEDERGQPTTRKPSRR